jgi:hypothetical protein
LQILLFTIEVGTDLKPDPIRIKKIKGMNCRRNHQERPRIYTDPIRFQSLQYLSVPPRPAGERDVLHRANRVAINLGNSFRIFKESDQTVAAHIKKIMRNVCVGRRTIPEHPEVVADRIERWAGIAGRENLVFGNDCGFQSTAGNTEIPITVAWAKLRALGEGARIASQRLSL